MGSSVINLLRQEERRARLKFWRLLTTVGTLRDVVCPISGDMPENAVIIGVMPKYLRATFVCAFELRAEERKGEAEIFEEALSELMQEHFKKVLAERKKRGEPDIIQFILGKDWSVYAVLIK